MSFVWDPMTAVNLVMCIIIVAFAVIGHRRSAGPLPLYIGIAFGLFGLAHLAALLGLKTSLEGLLIVVRTLAYLTVVFALYRVAFSPKSGA